MNFTDALATARRKLSEVEKHTTFDEDFFRARCTPEQFAELAARISTYKVRADELRAEVEALEAQACTRCDGTGYYAGASRRYRDATGQPKCFTCRGRGTR